MSNAPHDDDPWSDLAADLGVGHTPKHAPTPPPDDGAGFDLIDDAPDAAEGDVDDTQVIPSLHAEPTAEGDGPGEGGKKRRRRRRRKKKGGQPTDAAGTAGDEEGDDDAAEGDEAGEGEEAFAPAAEEPTAEVARDVIANWNVPSWEEVVAGLYRPGGDR